MFDLMIIGGGPAGYVAAERAGHKGLKVLLFEKKAMGGVCLNEGCIPTKTMLYSAKTYENALHGDKYGVFADNVRFDYGKIVGRKNKVVRKLVLGVESKMKANHVTVVEGEAKIRDRSTDGIEVGCNGKSYYGANLLICTGSEASVPPIPGLIEAGDIVVTNREILDLKEQPQSLVVIGGGVIGMEFASFFNSMGTKVTVVEMLPEILGGLDGEISAMLRNIYAKKGIEFHLDAKVVQVDGKRVVFEKDGKTQTVEGERILLSVGRRPVTEIRLDDYFHGKKDKPTFYKIDVEGAETAVLNGMKSILKQPLLKIALCTYHHAEDFEKFCRLLKENDFAYQPTNGVMIYQNEIDNMQPPYFRKGLIKAWKEK
jgi:dihydrolipoamide dehydrogenase